jgi:hypothetical protein
VRRTGILAIITAVVLACAFPPLASARIRTSQEPGRLSGTVTSPAGAPVSGAEVLFYPVGFRTGGDLDGDAGSTRTRYDGSFSIDVADWGLPDGAYVLRVVDGSGTYPDTWYDRAASPETATAVTLAADAVIAPLSIVMRDPVAPGTITGLVRGNGATIDGVQVFAYRAGGAEYDEPDAAMATDAAGRFTLEVDPGQYRVVADGSPYGLLRQWWNGQATFAAATVIDVGEAARIGGLTFDLSAQSGGPKRPGGRLLAPKKPFDFSHLAVDALEPYQGQRSCHATARKGTRAVRDLLLATYGSQEGAGLNRACAKGTSEHYDGRAIDWMVNSRVPAQARKGDSFAWWATRFRGKEAGALARRMGIMYIIWRGRIWKQYQADAGWQVYMKCDRQAYLKPSWDNDCHRNHVHISLTWHGARMRTSWWTGVALA